MWCKTDEEKDDRGPTCNGDVGIEGNIGSDTKGEWSEMVHTGICWGVMMGMFWEKHWSLRWEDVEDASQEGEQECWFGEEGCLAWIEWDGEWEFERLL